MFSVFRPKIVKGFDTVYKQLIYIRDMWKQLTNKKHNEYT